MKSLQKELANILTMIQLKKQKLNPPSRAAKLLKVFEELTKEQVQSENSNSTTR